VSGYSFFTRRYWFIRGVLELMEELLYRIPERFRTTVRPAAGKERQENGKNRIAATEKTNSET